eukprot:TRINITY_DN1742_c0_g1_i2.p1 TRINITY_DN1742_c0_g1~~TRINITY_DN1742_c0_g1_i2.p1  ORF type:complete len:956 (-),score=183.32 TRINITY_DN1742_c0_g1_i2:50-2773(-)
MEIFLKALSTSGIKLKSQELAAVLTQFGQGVQISYQAFLDCLQFDRASEIAKIDMSSSPRVLPQQVRPSSAASQRPGSALSQRQELQPVRPPMSPRPLTPRGSRPQTPTTPRSPKVAIMSPHGESPRVATEPAAPPAAPASPSPGNTASAAAAPVPVADDDDAVYIPRAAGHDMKEAAKRMKEQRNPVGRTAGDVDVNRPSNDVLDLAAKLRDKALQEKDLRSVFRKYNSGHSGEIERDEFMNFVRSYHFVHPNRIVNDLFDYIDKDHSGKIDFDEFSTIVQEDGYVLSSPFASDTHTKHLYHGKQGVINENRTVKPRAEPPHVLTSIAAMGGVSAKPRFTDDVEHLRDLLKQKIYEKSNLLAKTFRAFDKDHSGFLDKEEFKIAVQSFHLQVPDESIFELFDRANTDGSGVLNYQEFADYLLIDNQQRGEFTLTEEEKKRKYVFLDDCVMFSDVRPPPRVSHSPVRDLSTPDLTNVVNLRQTMNEQYDAQLTSIIKQLKRADLHCVGRLPRSEFDRVLKIASIDVTQAALRSAIDSRTNQDGTVDYVDAISHLQRMHLTDGLEIHPSPLGNTGLRAPYAVQTDGRHGKKVVASSIAAKYERMVRAFQLFDRERTGFLNPTVFRNAVEQMRLGLRQEELTQVVLRAQQGQAGSDIDYRSFVSQMFDSSGAVPHFLTYMKSRDSGDILAWSTPKVRHEGVKDRLLYFHGEMVLNDNVEVERPSAQFEHLTARPTTPSSSSSHLSEKEALFRTTNPLLARQSLGTPRTSVDQLPSDSNPEFVYGIRSGQRTNMRSLMGNLYGEEWIQQRKQQELLRRHSLSSGHSGHRKRSETRTTQLRKQEVVRRLEHLESARSGVYSPRPMSAPASALASRHGTPASGRPSPHAPPTARSPHANTASPRARSAMKGV